MIAALASAAITMRSTLTHLFAFQTVADAALLTLIRDLPPAQLDTQFPLGPGTLRRILIHNCECELWWLSVARGQPATAGPPDNLSLDQYQSLRANLTAERETLLREWGDTGPLETVSYTTRAGRPLSRRRLDLLLHILNHAHHHRAQALNMLRHLGHATPDFDYSAMLPPDSRPGIDPPPILDPTVLTALTHHASRATNALLTPLATLQPNLLHKPHPIGPAPGSALSLLHHLIAAESFWLAQTTATPADFWQLYHQAETLQDLPSLKASLDSLTTQALSWLHPTPPNPTHPTLDIHKPLSTVPARDPALTPAQVVLHLALHRTHHHAQLADTLRQQSATPPSLDYLALLPT